MPAYGRGMDLVVATPRDVTMPTGAIAETVPRRTATLGNVAQIISGRLHLCPLVLSAGTTVTSATFMSATTAGSGMTNQWFALYDSALALLRQTADDTSTAWGSSTAKTLTFTSTFTTIYTGLYYLGINVTGSTVPSLYCTTSNANPIGIAPKLNGHSTTTLTDTAPANALAITAQASVPWAYVS